MENDLVTRIFGEDGELDIDKPDEGLAEYKKRKKEAREKMIMLQSQPYEIKVRRSRLRAEEFMEQMQMRDKSAHVSVGGLDSITLHVFLKSIGINVPAVSVSSLEDKSIQRVHKALGVTILNPLKTKVEVLNEVGFPVISKRIAGKIALLQNPTENNKTVRHAIITGECGELGHFQKNSRMKLPQKWLNLFGGYENENEGVMYYKPKAIFADAVAASHTSILIGDLAKLISQNGVSIGQKRLFKWLRDNGYLIKREGSDRNMPTQRSMEMKLFEVKESTISNPDGSVRITRTPKVTGKGQQYFVNKFLAI